MSNPFSKKITGFSLLSMMLAFQLTSAPLMADDSDDESDEGELVIVGGPLDIPQFMIRLIIIQNEGKAEKALVDLAMARLKGKNPEAVKKAIRNELRKDKRHAATETVRQLRLISAETKQLTNEGLTDGRLPVRAIDISESLRRKGHEISEESVQYVWSILRQLKQRMNGREVHPQNDSSVRSQAKGPVGRQSDSSDANDPSESGGFTAKRPRKDDGN